LRTIKAYQNKEWLNNQYWNENKSTPEISKICNCNPVTIRYWMKKFNIPRRNCSEAQKICTTGNRFQKGKLNPMYYGHSKESKKKISDATKGSNNPMYGKKHSEETKQKIREKAIGRIVSEETRKKQSQARKGLLINEKNPMWKGNEVGRGVHEWVRKRKPKPEVCEICKEKEPKHLSNKDHKYSRNIDDYQWVCVKCHWHYDENKFKSHTKNKKRLKI